MTETLVQVLSSLPKDGKLRGYFYNEPITITRLSTDSFRMVVPGGGGKVYGPGSGSGENGFVKAPVFPLSEFSYSDLQTTEEYNGTPQGKESNSRVTIQGRKGTVYINSTLLERSERKIARAKNNGSAAGGGAALE